MHLSIMSLSVFIYSCFVDLSFSEEKAKLLRRICGLIEEKNEELQYDFTYNSRI